MISLKQSFIQTDMYEMSHFQENIFGFLSIGDGNYVTREDNGNFIIFGVLIFHVHVNHYNDE